MSATSAQVTLQLKSVVDLGNFQPTGIGVSREGRIFISSPITRIKGWSVVEVMPNGSFQPYQDQEWNRKWHAFPKDKNPGNHFIAAQALYRVRNNDLWVLDHAAVGQLIPVFGGPKLVQFDLATNRIERVYRFDDVIVPMMAFPNDVRIDNTHNYPYITDSKLGALIALNYLMVKHVVSLKIILLQSGNRGFELLSMEKILEMIWVIHLFIKLTV